MNKLNFFSKDNNNSRSRFLEEFKEATLEKSVPPKDAGAEDPYLKSASIFNKTRKSTIISGKIEKPKLAPLFKPANVVKSNFDTKKSPKFPLLPVIKPDMSKRASTSAVKSLPEKEQKVEQRSNRFTDGRKLRLVTGTVDYVIKINKIYPNLVSLYEVYGKFLKTLNGKYSCERIIWLKSQQGPVLKVLFYEIDTTLPLMEAGNSVFCVGRFTSKGQFHAFKIKPISDVNESAIMRFRNICNFVLNNDTKSETKNESKKVG